MPLWVGVAYHASIQVASLTLVRYRYARFDIVEQATIVIRHCFASELTDYLKLQYPQDSLVVAVGIDTSQFLRYTLTSKKRLSSRMLALMIKHVVEKKWGCCLREWQVKVFAKHPVYCFYGVKKSWLIRLKHCCQQANIQLSVLVPLELTFYHVVLVDNRYDALVFFQNGYLYWQYRSNKKKVKYDCQSFQCQNGDNQLNNLLSTALKQAQTILLVSDIEESKLALNHHCQLKVRVFNRDIECPAVTLFSLLLANQAYVTF